MAGRHRWSGLLQLLRPDAATRWTGWALPWRGQGDPQVTDQPPTIVVAMSEHDLCDMAICAVRYAIGRKSYAAIDGQRWAVQFAARSDRVRQILTHNIEEALETSYRMRPDGLLDSEQVELGWRAVLAQLKAMEPGA